MSLRVLAWQLLRREREDPLRLVDDAAEEARLDRRDRAFLRRLVGTEVRRRGTLRAIARAFAKGRPDADLAIHLRLGLAQVFFLDQVPDHAAVGETVGAARETLGPRQAGYVNAVLRAALVARRPGPSGEGGDPRRDLPLRELHLAEPVFPDRQEHPILWAEDALSMPAALVRRWIRRYGEERAFELCRGALAEPDLSLRAVGGGDGGGRDGVGRDEVARELGVETRPGLHPSILLAASSATEAVVGSACFREGRVTVQGETALRAAELLEARAGERILELCAAPGGKTAVLAASGASVVACDASPARLARAGEGLRRLVPGAKVGLVACDGASAIASTGAGTGAGAGAGAGEAFDGILVDAPCSNTGVLAQRPAARWRFSTATQRALCGLQDRLLGDAASRVRPGGRIVYSTCSIEPEENRRRVEAFLAARGGFELEAEVDELPEPRGVVGPVDGGYAARIRRT